MSPEGPVTEKLKLLDAIITGATKVQELTLEIAATEGILRDDLSRFQDIMVEDEELRDKLRADEWKENQKTNYQQNARTKKRADDKKFVSKTKFNGGDK